MSGTVETKLSRKYLLNVARKFVSINHTGKWQIGIGLSLAGKNLHGCSFFLLPLQNVNQIICRKIMENINFSDHYFQRYLIGNIISF